MTYNWLNQIPGDWNGDDWTCYAIRWPDTPEFRHLLISMLFSLTRGRQWDDETGSVIDATKDGWAIYDNNTPLAACLNGSGTHEDVREVIRAIGGAIGKEDAIMSLCGYNPKAFKIENGSLWVRDFCGEWIEIGALATVASDPIEEPPWVDPEDDDTWSKCGKAAGYINTIRAICQAAWGAVALSPAEWEGHVRAAADWATMGRASLFLTVTNAQVLQVLTDEGTVFDDDRWQRMICLAILGMEDTPVMTEDERWYCYNSMRSVVFSDFGAVVEEDMWAFVQNAVDTLGAADGRHAGTVGSADLDAECDCPEVSSDIDPLGVVTFEGIYTDVTVPDRFSDWTFVNSKTVQFKFSNNDTVNYVDLGLTIPLAASGPVRQLEVKMTRLDAPQSDLPTAAWQDTYPTSDEYYQFACSNSPLLSDYYGFPGESRMVFTWLADEDLDGGWIYIAGMRMYPSLNCPLDKEMTLQFQISYSGAQRT